ncbi:membrane protein [Marmoricola endophyticus]|uniref:Membrane protein n=1 Tax=Marmoricola endophyticus TaxID=2040280 RepID=A0A917BA70_9ACTN|nr:membrane protein [Marmoricola endophyticus]
MAAAAGLVVAVLVVVAAFVVPPLLGWDVRARVDQNGAAPTHGYWEAKVGIGTIPAVLLAVLGVRYATGLAQRLTWRWLLLAAFVAGLAWMLALAYVDGSSGMTRVLGNAYEYLPTARDVTNLPGTIDDFIRRIPYAAGDNWVTHIAGHPVGALITFVVLVRLGLGGDYSAAMVVTLAAATIAPAVLVTLRRLGAEPLARRAAPYLVLTPAAVFMAVSADALFAAIAAWGLAALACAATSARTGPMIGWAGLAGLLLGWCVLLSYGLLLLGLLAVAVLLVARSWRPLPVAVVAALVPVLVLAAMGFAWWDAYPVLVERYNDGVAMDRPMAYWWWGNLGALLVSAGPLLGAGLGLWAARLGGMGRAVRARLRESPERAVLILVGAAVLTIALADASGMSKAEVERIWIPFIPWLTISLALLPRRWGRWALGGQVVFALAVQHLLYTSW